MTKIFFVLMLVPPLLGLGLAWAIYAIQPDKYEIRIKAAAATDMQWIYAAAWLFFRLTSFLNNYPMMKKAHVMSGKAGNLRANMYIFKVLDAPSDKTTPVVLEEDGAAGEYNRANRSLHHFVENTGAFCAGLYLVGVIFPIPASWITFVYAIGRVTHQVGYSGGGYGSHGAGFGIATLALAIMEGFLLLVVIKSL